MLAAVSIVLVALAANPATPATDCPSPAELAATLNARMPGLAPVTPSAPLSLASGMRLSVVTSPEGDVRVDLVDAKDEIVLHRLLPAPPSGHAPDCPALAETIAIIVERYLHDIGYEAPTAPPPPPAPPPPAPAPSAPTTLVAEAAPAVAGHRAHAALWRLGVAASGRRGDAGGFDGDGDLALGVEGTSEHAHLGARLSVGLAPRASATWGATDRATLLRVPFRLGGYVGLPLGPGRLEPGIGIGADLLRVAVTGNGQGGGYLAPSGDLALTYTMPLIGAMYGRALSRIALAEPYTFKALGNLDVWGTPRVYGELGVELGVAFP